MCATLEGSLGTVRTHLAGPLVTYTPPCFSTALDGRLASQLFCGWKQIYCIETLAVLSSPSPMAVNSTDGHVRSPPSVPKGPRHRAGAGMSYSLATRARYACARWCFGQAPGGGGGGPEAALNLFGARRGADGSGMARWPDSAVAARPTRRPARVAATATAARSAAMASARYATPAAARGLRSRSAELCGVASCPSPRARPA